MSQITVVLALASPLLHARLRAELGLDPDIRVLHDTGNARRALEETARLRPEILMVDRDMIIDAALDDPRLRPTPMPAVVLVTVYKEGIPARRVLQIEGTIPFDTRPGDLAQQLRQILSRVRPPAELLALPPPVRSELQHRFTVSESPPLAASKSGPGDDAAPSYAKQPRPSKTSRLAKTGFLRSMFDDTADQSKEERATSGRL